MWMVDSTEMKDTKSSLMKRWHGKVRRHVAKFIRPILSKGDYGEKAEELMFYRLCQILRRKDSSNTVRLPINKSTKSIYKLKDSSVPILSSITKNSYLVPKVGQEEQTLDTSPLLIGLLQADGGIRNHLYLADGSGHVIVVMVHAKSEFVNSIVLITSWKYLRLDSNVPLRLPGYVEVTGEVVELLPTNKLTGIPATISTVGTVTHVSSILRFDKWEYVVTILQHKDSKVRTVVVKNQSLSYMSQMLTIGSVVGFSSLRKSKMKFGGRAISLHRLCESETADILDSFAESTDMSVDRCKAYLREKMKVHILEYNLFRDNDFTNYIGEITCVISEELGIYELDYREAILHITYQLCIDYGIGKRVGSLLMASYVHHFQDANGVLNLVCCGKSNVVTVRPSDTLQDWRPIRLVGYGGNKLVKDIKSCANFHPQQMLYLVDFARSLRTNFPFLNGYNLLCPEEDESIMHKLLGLSSHIVDNGKYSEKVNMFAEVLDNPHSCIALRSMGHVANTYHVLTIKELCNQALNMSQNLNNNRYKEYWCHVLLSEAMFGHENNEKWDESSFLLGLIDLSTGGKITIEDSTGIIECVVLTDDFDLVNGVKRFPWCTQDIGCFVRVKRFSIIVEALFEPPDNQDYKDTGLMSDFVMDDDRSEISYHFYIVAQSRHVQVIATSDGVAATMTLGCSGYVASPVAEDMPAPSGPGARIDSLATSGSHEAMQDMVIFVIQEATAYNQFSMRGIVVEDFKKKQEIMFDFKNARRWLPFIRSRIVLKMSFPSDKGTSPVILVDSGFSISHYHGSSLLRDEIPFVTEKILSVGEALRDLRPLRLVRGKITLRKGFLDRNLHQQRLYFSSADGARDGQQLCIYLGRTSDLNIPNCCIPESVVVIRPVKIFRSEKGNVYCRSYSEFYVESIPLASNLSARDTIHSARQLPIDTSTKELMLRDLMVLDASSEVSQAAQLLIINVFPMKVLSVTVSPGSFYTDAVSFHARCAISDHTGHARLNFYSSCLHDFFKFIGIDDLTMTEFTEIVSASDAPKLQYDAFVHSSDVATAAVDSPGDKGLLALIYMCNSVNSSVMPPRKLLVRNQGLGNQGSAPSSVPAKANPAAPYTVKHRHLHCVRLLE